MTGFAALPLADEAQDDRGRRWAGVAHVVGPAWTRLPSLTVGLFGVQMLWSVEMSYASPYLLSLGLPKSLMAIVFLAGPLSGLVVQPMIGILADNSKSPFGRRRPFIVVSAALCAFATLLLGFTRPFATIFTTLDSPSNDTLTIWLAILAIYCIDFCINAGEHRVTLMHIAVSLQALDRALLVDTLPTAKQPAGNAWAATMLAIGSVAGFFVGNLDLPHLIPFLGSAQLEVLTVIAALLLFLTQAWVCVHVKERVLLASSSGPKGLGQELRELRGTLLRLPSVIRQICWIQFFAWLGWFPVLFYSTVYIGDLHKKASPFPETKAAAIALDVESTRLGTRALFYSALVSLAANIIMPSFVVPQHARHATSPLAPKHKTWLERVRMHLASLWAFSHLIFASCMAATFVTSTVSGATLIIAVTGFCWAMTQWAPFALLSEAILSHPATDDAGSIHLADTRSTRVVRPRDDVTRDADEEGRWLFRADVDDEEEGEGSDAPNGSGRGLKQDELESEGIVLGHARARVSRIDVVTPTLAAHSNEGHGRATATAMVAGKSESGLSAQAGAIIGIHNLFVVIPQFLVTALSSIVFALLDPTMSVLYGRHPGDTADGTSTVGDAASGVLGSRQDGEVGRGPDSIAIIFRFGGVAAAIAFVLCYRLAKDLARH
ncbi:MFS general substrate transporter [Imleria badia]|nr:MFS general substrate transporter [Imleria badia]